MHYDLKCRACGPLGEAGNHDDLVMLAAAHLGERHPTVAFPDPALGLLCISEHMELDFPAARLPSGSEVTVEALPSSPSHSGKNTKQLTAGDITIRRG